MAIELSNEQKKIFDNVRNTLTELLAVASRSDVPEKDIETLQNTLKLSKTNSWWSLSENLIPGNQHLSMRC